MIKLTTIEGVITTVLQIIKMFSTSLKNNKHDIKICWKYGLLRDFILRNDNVRKMKSLTRFQVSTSIQNNI